MKKQNYVISTLKLFFVASPTLFIIIELLTVIQGLMPFLSLIIFRMIIDRAGIIGVIDRSILLFSLLWTGTFFVQNLVILFNNSLREILNRKTLLVMNAKIMNKTLSFHGIKNFESAQYREMERRLDFCSNMLPYFLDSFTDISQYVLQCVSVFFLFGDIGVWIPIAIIISLIPTIFSHKKIADLDADFERQISVTRIREMYLRRNAISPRYAKEFRIFNFAKVFERQYKNVQDNLYSITKTFQRKNITFGLVGVLPRILVAGIFLYYLFYMVIAEGNAIYTVGMLALYMQSVFIFSDSFIQIANWRTEVKRALHTIQYFFEYLHYEDTVEISANPVSFEEEIKEIKFEKVCFYYDESQPVLDNISFTLTAGEVMAIVGENGAGKTTLVKLLLRFYDTTSGTIFVNGIDIKNYDLKQYRSKMSAIFQDYAKFELSLQESIAPGEERDEDLPDEDIDVLGESLYKSLPNGFNTMLGVEFGERELSVGEWQRIAILRGLRKSADVFIVDEPTASIDPIQEAKMYEKIISHAAKMTVLITHRLGSIQKAQRILVLKNGKLIAIDAHDVLMETCNYYAELYNSQANMYKTMRG